MPIGDYYDAMEAVRGLAWHAPASWQRLFAATIYCRFKQGDIDAVQMAEFILDTALTWQVRYFQPTTDESRPLEIRVNTLGAFFATVGVAKGLLEDMCGLVYGLDKSKWLALAEALIEGKLRGEKDWHDARSPVLWVRKAAANIHKGHTPISMDQLTHMSSLDAPSPTGDPYASLLPDLRRTPMGAEINARVDLVTACQREGLAQETTFLTLGQYNGVPRSVTANLLGLSKQKLAAASREIQIAKPALQARLAFYRLKKAPRIGRI